MPIIPHMRNTALLRGKTYATSRRQRTIEGMTGPPTDVVPYGTETYLVQSDRWYLYTSQGHVRTA